MVSSHLSIVLLIACVVVSDVSALVKFGHHIPCHRLGRGAGAFINKGSLVEGSSAARHGGQSSTTYNRFITVRSPMNPAECVDRAQKTAMLHQIYLFRNLYDPSSYQLETGHALRAKTEDDGIESENTIVQARIIITGQVQGGYYRACAKNEARFRGLLGGLVEHVDGSTEIIVEGKSKFVKSFIAWCKRGPGLSQQVNTVEVEYGMPTGAFDGFICRPLSGASP